MVENVFDITHANVNEATVEKTAQNVGSSKNNAMLRFFMQLGYIVIGVSVLHSVISCFRYTGETHLIGITPPTTEWN